MFSFEGNYKRLPIQSLGGESRLNVSEKDVLLAKAQEKRKQRLQLKIENASATTIQAAYRSFKLRKCAFGEERKRFIDMMKSVGSKPTVEVVSRLLSSLCFFFKAGVDDDCLLQFCMVAIKIKASVVLFVYTGGTQSFFLLKRWLSFCVGLLHRLAEQNQNTSICLRIFEIYLDSEVMSLDPEDGQQKLITVYSSLCHQGYFKCMRTLCDNKIPSSLNTSARAPTPLAKSIFDMILKPLTLSSISAVQQHRTVVMQSFSEWFMSPPYSRQVYCYIFPALCVEECLSVRDLLLALENGKSIIIKKTGTLLHSLMSFTSSRLDSLDEEFAGIYLNLLSDLWPSICTENICCYVNEEEDVTQCMDWQSGDVLSAKQMSEECFQMLNSVQHVTKVQQLLNRGTDHITTLCKLCHTILSKMGKSVHTNGFLYSLAFNNSFLKCLWRECTSVSVVNSTGKEISLMQMVSRGLDDSYSSNLTRLIPLLSLFSSLFYYSVLSLHDKDFQSHTGLSVLPSNPFTQSEIVAMVSTLRDACLGIINLAIPDAKPLFDDRRQFLEELGITSEKRYVSREEYAAMRGEWVYLFKVTARLIKHLYTRDTRQRFCPENHWLSSQVHIYSNQLRFLYQNYESAFNKQPLDEVTGYAEDDSDVLLSVPDTRKLVILTELPFVVPFQERVKIFQQLVAHDKDNHQSPFDGYGSRTNSTIDISVRRDYLYEDAFEKLSVQNETSLKPKIRVQMRNATGLDEIGVDGGGIFREFLLELLKTGFDPNRGIFKYTSDRRLYPNPEAPELFEDYTTHFFFLGRMLGKVLYENMLVELPFAGFFLSKILGKSESNFHQLASLDPELYRNLLFVKNYDGDVEELGLDFSVVNSKLGVTEHLELKHNGKNIVVNSSNRIEYIHLMADYKLNKQIRIQCQAFTEGLQDIVNPEWLKMFNYHELHVLISGATTPIDVDDLRCNTKYSGGYSDDHPTIKSFWSVVKSLTSQQKSLLLRFVTSCSRPPLLGFRDLYPAFCIHHGGEEERLPTASTCMNFLKLPNFKTEEAMKEKLLYAIESGAGFELS